MQGNHAHSLHLWCINPVGFHWPFFFLSTKFDTVAKKLKLFVTNLMIFVKKSPTLEKYQKYCEISTHGSSR
jgi:hypothetical protein